MSSIPPTSNPFEYLQLFQELEGAWPILTNQYYVLTSTFVLVLYDYFLTLPLEVAEIWSGEMTGVKVLFLLNRYPYLLSLLSGLLYTFLYTSDAPFKSEKAVRCNALWHIQTVLSLVQAMAMFFIFSLKIFAIYQKNFFILFILCTVTISFILTLLWTIVVHQGSRFSSMIAIGPFTCQVTAPDTFAADRWLLTTYAIMILFTSLVFCLAIAKTIRLAIQARKANVKISLVLLILRDGSLYYFIILMLEIADVITASLYMKSQQDSSNNETIALVYACFVSVSSGLDWILGNRLVLNLSRTATAVAESQSFSAVRFATNSLLGNIGAPLRVGSEDTWDSDLYGSDISNSMELDDVSTRKSYKESMREPC